MAGVATDRIEAQTQGEVPAEVAEFAVDKVGSLLRAASEPVLGARIKLLMAPDPAVERPAIAQINVDLNGRLIRAHAEGVKPREAVERACDRLRIRLERVSRNWEATRGEQPAGGPAEWRHQEAPAERPPYYPRPRAEREIVRRKSYALRHETPDDAVADAESLDYDFHLFTELSTGEDAVIYRAEDGHRLSLAHNRASRLGPVSDSITISRIPAARLSLAAAADRLEATGQAFLFFVNAATSRGSVLYHRYDGHYGLIEPAS